MSPYHMANVIQGMVASINQFRAGAAFDVDSGAQLLNRQPVLLLPALQGDAVLIGAVEVICCRGSR